MKSWLSCRSSNIGNVNWRNCHSDLVWGLYFRVVFLQSVCSFCRLIIMCGHCKVDYWETGDKWDHDCHRKSVMWSVMSWHTLKTISVLWYLEGQLNPWYNPTPECPCLLCGTFLYRFLSFLCAVFSTKHLKNIVDVILEGPLLNVV